MQKKPEDLLHKPQCMINTLISQGIIGIRILFIPFFISILTKIKTSATFKRNCFFLLAQGSPKDQRNPKGRTINVKTLKNTEI